MSLKIPKSLKNIKKKSPSQMPDLQFLKTLTFPRALEVTKLSKI